MNPIYSRRVRRIPPIVSDLTRQYRRRRVQKGGTFIPIRTKRLNNRWITRAVKRRRRRRR